MNAVAALQIREHAGSSDPVSRCGGPIQPCGRELVSIRQLLEWAFGREHAQLDFDEIAEVSGGAMPGRGAEVTIAEQLALGMRAGEGVRVDRSFGRSRPHADAEIVATALRNAMSWSQAVWVADLARGGTCPRWDIGATRCEPRAWGKANHRGQKAKSEVLVVVEYRSRRRGSVRREIMWTPVFFTPTASQIGSARRAYLAWCGCLLDLLADLRHVDLQLFVLSDRLPDFRPWKNA